MGAVRYEFSGVPGDADPRPKHPENPPWRDVRYLGIYEDLSARGLPVPAEPPETIDRASLVAHLQVLLGELVRAEITEDPHRAYVGIKSLEDRAAAFSNHLLDEKGREVRQSRLSKVLERFPHGPNALTAKDINAALGNE